jgi:hypothetical protein
MMHVNIATADDLLLETLCDLCKGAGFLASEEWHQWAARHQDALRRGLTARRALRDAGPMPPLPPGEPCARCGGTGRVPTAFGVQVLELVRRTFDLGP